MYIKNNSYIRLIVIGLGTCSSSISFFLPRETSFLSLSKLRVYFAILSLRTRLYAPHVIATTSYAPEKSDRQMRLGYYSSPSGWHFDDNVIKTELRVYNGEKYRKEHQFCKRSILRRRLDVNSRDETVKQK